MASMVEQLRAIAREKDEQAAPKQMVATQEMVTDPEQPFIFKSNNLLADLMAMKNK